MKKVLMFYKGKEFNKKLKKSVQKYEDCEIHFVIESIHREQIKYLIKKDYSHLNYTLSFFEDFITATNHTTYDYIIGDSPMITEGKITKKMFDEFQKAVISSCNSQTKIDLQSENDDYCFSNFLVEESELI